MRIRILALALGLIWLAGCAPKAEEPAGTQTPDAGSTATTADPTQAPDFALSNLKGETVQLASLSKDKPVFLYFIKVGCPVNEPAVKHYNDVAKAYGDKANVVGIINVGAEEAERWASRKGVTFTLLADPDLKATKGFGIERSPAVVEIIQGHKLGQVWRGVSVDALSQLNQKVAAAAGEEVAKVSFEGAPTRMRVG